LEGVRIILDKLPDGSWECPYCHRIYLPSVSFCIHCFKSSLGIQELTAEEVYKTVLDELQIEFYKKEE